MNTAPIKPLAVDSEGAAALTTLSTATIKVEIRNGNFPRPRQLSKGRVGWRIVDIEEWLASRPESEALPPPNTGHDNRRRGPREAQG